MHACDYVDESGEEISTSLMPEYVQIEDKHACDFIDADGEEISTSLMPEYLQIDDDEPAEAEEAPSEEAAAQTEEQVEETAEVKPSANGILTVAESRQKMAE